MSPLPLTHRLDFSISSVKSECDSSLEGHCFLPRLFLHEGACTGPAAPSGRSKEPLYDDDDDDDPLGMKEVP